MARIDEWNGVSGLALMKAVEHWAKENCLDKLDRALEPGNYPVSMNFVVRVNGALKRQEDYLARPTNKVPLLTVIALLLEKSGITGDASRQMIVDAMKEAIELGEKAEEKLCEHLKFVEIAKAEVEEMMSKLPKVKCKGALRAVLETKVECLNTQKAMGVA